MTRTELVKQKAQEFASSGEFSPTHTECFIAGAEWEYKRIVEKACGWLNSVDMRMYVIADHTSSNINRFAINKFISDFRKAMEE